MRVEEINTVRGFIPCSDKMLREILESLGISQTDYYQIQTQLSLNPSKPAELQLKEKTIIVWLLRERPQTFALGFQPKQVELDFIRKHPPLGLHRLIHEYELAIHLEEYEKGYAINLRNILTIIVESNRLLSEGIGVRDDLIQHKQNVIAAETPTERVMLSYPSSTYPNANVRKVAYQGNLLVVEQSYSSLRKHRELTPVVKLLVQDAAGRPFYDESPTSIHLLSLANQIREALRPLNTIFTIQTLK